VFTKRAVLVGGVGSGFLLFALPRVSDWICFLFSLNEVDCSRVGVPTAFAIAGFMLALLFIFFDPCAGRHLLLLLRQKK
jgi:hypothetical protein